MVGFSCEVQRIASVSLLSSLIFVAMMIVSLVCVSQTRVTDEAACAGFAVVSSARRFVAHASFRTDVEQIIATMVTMIVIMIVIGLVQVV